MNIGPLIVYRLLTFTTNYNLNVLENYNMLFENLNLNL